MAEKWEDQGWVVVWANLRFGCEAILDIHDGIALGIIDLRPPNQS
jgi:hypothetical protein